MIDQKTAFETIEKARKQKQNQWDALIKAGCQNPSDYIIEYREKNNIKSNDQVSKFYNKQLIYSESKNSATLESNGTIKTVDELLKAGEVDLEIWEVERFTLNKGEVVLREPATTVGGAGKDALIVDNEKGGKHTLWTRASNKPVHEQLFYVKIWLKKKKNAETNKELIEWFRKEVIAIVPKDKWKYIKPINSKKKYCLELAVPDIHIGKLSWAPETGANYDSNEAVRLYEEAVFDLIGKAPMDKVDHILLPIGNDFFHTDNAKDETTSGTYVGSDTRWQKLFMKGTSLLVKIISELAKTHKVTVPIVQGNHDFEKSFYLGECLKAYFNNHPNVIINNNPTTRKYFRYGANLIGFTHGSEEKINTLPLILANECSLDWSETKFREIHVGHWHKEANNEYQGIKVRFLPSLCAADAWHGKKGFIGAIRSAIGFLWNFDKGLEAQLYCNL